MKRTRTGFTLIELLVVIAIIAILAAILFPIFAAVKEKGRQTACLNNMKQLGMGFRLYLDNYGRYPGAGLPPGEWVRLVPGSTRYLTKYVDVAHGSIFPYVKNKSVYICPSDALERKDKFGLSYSMNAILGVNGGPYLKDSEVKRTSRCVLLVDEGAGSRDSGGNLCPLVDGYFGGYWGLDEPAECHVGGGNFLFCDTHAKWLPKIKFRDTSILNYDPWH